MTRARAGLLVVVIIGLGASLSACSTEAATPLSEAAQDRILRGYELIESADGINSIYATVATDADTEIASSCVSVTIEPRSVAPDRQSLAFGSFAESANMCAPDTWFVVDQSTVYVPTDETPPGRHAWIHDWADVREPVIAEISEVDGQAELRYRTLLDSASNAVEHDAVISFDVGRDALVKSGAMKEGDLKEGTEARARFFFTKKGGPIKEIHFTVTNGAATVETWYLFDSLNEPQDITIPKAPFLNQKSKPVETVEQFNAFVGLK